MGLPRVGWSHPRELSITFWYSGLVLIRIPALEAIFSKAEYVSFHLYQVTAGVGVEVAAHTLRCLGVHELEGPVVLFVQPCEDAAEPPLPVI